MTEIPEVPEEQLAEVKVKLVEQLSEKLLHQVKYLQFNEQAEFIEGEFIDLYVRSSMGRESVDELYGPGMFDALLTDYERRLTEEGGALR